MTSQPDGSDEIAVFRMAEPTACFFIACAAISILGAAVFLASLLRTHPTGEAMWTSAPWFAVSFWPIVTAILFRVYRIEAGYEGMRVAGLLGSRDIEFKDIKKITLKQGSRAGTSSSYMAQVVVRVSSSINNLEALLGIIRMRASRYGATFMRRDRDGAWQHPSI